MYRRALCVSVFEYLRHRVGGAAALRWMCCRYENGEKEHCLELWNRDGKGLQWTEIIT